MANETLSNNEELGVQQETIQPPVQQIQPIVVPQAQPIPGPVATQTPVFEPAPVAQQPALVQRQVAQTPAPVELKPVIQPVVQPVTTPVATQTPVFEQATVEQKPALVERKVVPAEQTTVVDQAPERGIDLTATEDLLRQRQIDTEEELRRISAAQKQSDINTLTHNAIAKNRDSGYLNAQTLATLRSNNNKLFDGLTASNNKFTTDMLTLSKQKAEAEADFNSEDYQDWQNSKRDIYNSLLEGGDFDGAYDYAQAVSDAGGGVMWDDLADPANKDITKANYDKNITERFNDTVVKSNLDIAVGANVDSLQSMGESKNRIIQSLNQMPDQAKWHINNFYSGFDSTNPASFEAYGVDNQAEADIVKEYLDGNIDFSDSSFQDIYAEGFINVVQNDEAKSARKGLYGDLSVKYEGSPTATKLLDRIVDSNFGENGSVNFDGTTFSTYGIPLNVNSVETAPGLDFHFTDWEGNPYVDGTDFNFDTSTDDPIEIGGVSFTNGQLNDMYGGYHEDFGKEYSKLPEDQQNILRQQVMNQDEFKEEILNLIQDGASKEELASLLSGRKKVVAGGETQFIEGDQFVSPDGTTTNFSSLDIDIDAFDPTEREIVEDIASGDMSIHDLSPEELTQLQSQDVDGDIVRKLADAGYITRSSVTTDQFRTGDKGILPVESNSSNNIFTGKNASELYSSLKDGTGYVMIGDKMYYVTGTPTRHDLSKGKSYPVVDWEVQVVTEDGSGDISNYRGILTDDKGDSIKENSQANGQFVSSLLTTGIEGIDPVTLKTQRSNAFMYYDQIPDRKSKDIIYNSYIADNKTDNSFVEKYEQEFGTGGN